MFLSKRFHPLAFRSNHHSFRLWSVIRIDSDWEPIKHCCDRRKIRGQTVRVAGVSPGSTWIGKHSGCFVSKTSSTNERERERERGSTRRNLTFSGDSLSAKRRIIVEIKERLSLNATIFHFLSASKESGTPLQNHCRTNRTAVTENETGMRWSCARASSSSSSTKFQTRDVSLRRVCRKGKLIFGK